MGHGSVMLRCCYVHGRGGVGWGMVASCYVAATFMGGVGWGIVYRMKTQKKRLTVSTCNFLRIANSLQIPVQNEHDAKCPRKHSTFAQFYMTTI